MVDHRTGAIDKRCAIASEKIDSPRVVVAFGDADETRSRQTTSRAARTLWREVTSLECTYDPAHVSVDVSTYTPLARETLQFMRFAPVAQAPAIVYHHGERIDPDR